MKYIKIRESTGCVGVRWETLWKKFEPTTTRLRVFKSTESFQMYGRCYGYNNALSIFET